MAEQEAPKVVLRGPTEGDSIILPMGLQRARITRKAARTETGGHWALGEAWQDPGFDNPPHTHDEAEAFYVLEGTLAVRVGDGEVEAPPGTYACVPPGIVHTFANRSDGPVRFLNLNTPGGWEDYIRDLAAATPADGPPDPQLMGEILARHDLLL